MMLVFVLVLLFFQKIASDCIPDAVEWNSQCFSFYPNSSGFADAELKCKNIGGHLASIHDGFTNALLAQEGTNHFQKSTETDFWIGATNLLKPPTWNWTDGTPFDFTDWKKGEPQNTSGLNCAALSMTDGLWSAQDCFVSKPFACQTSPLPTTPSYPFNANCSQGWYYVAPAHACYGANGGLHDYNWTAAQSYCESIDAQLPSIHTYAEYQYLQSLIHAYWRNLWIGIFSIDGGTTWKYSDGSVADFLNYSQWCDNHPIKNVTGERCVAIGAPCFFDVDCSSYSQDTICKKPF